MEINKVYNENCLETMGRMGDNFIDLVVTSPPYDNLRKYNGYSFDFEPIARELYRVMKVGGVVVWVVGDATVKGSETGTSFKQALFFKEIGFNLHDTMIYAKNNYVPLNHNRYEQQFEYMFVFSKGKPSVFNPIKTKCSIAGEPRKVSRRKEEPNHSYRNREEEYVVNKDKIKPNIWFYTVGWSHSSKNSVAFSHPAIFPEQLARDHIVSWSNEGDLVYDPFMGSGTTAKMAILEERNFIGSEMSGEYCKIIEERINIGYRELEDIKSQLTLF